MQFPSITMINGHNRSKFWMQPFTWRLRWTWTLKNSQLSTARGMQFWKSRGEELIGYYSLRINISQLSEICQFWVKRCYYYHWPVVWRERLSIWKYSAAYNFPTIWCERAGGRRDYLLVFYILHRCCQDRNIYLRNVTKIGGFSERLVLAAEPKVAAWDLLLPTCKKDPLGTDGKVDELLFLAHLIVCIAGITLHQTFSSLTYSVEELYPETFPPAPINAILPPKQSGWSSYTVKALK